MKRLKIIWATMMAALLCAGIFTGQREYFLLLFIMGFVLLFSLSLNLWTVFSLTYTQKIDEPTCVKGSRTSMRIAIYNETMLPFALLRVTAQPVVRSHRIIMNLCLLPRNYITFIVPLACPYMGIFDVGMARLEINDSFGLVRTGFSTRILPHYRSPSLKVNPKLNELPALPARRADTKYFGNSGALFAEQGDSYADLRKYRPGDPLKRIHRAVFAKRREMYVKTYDEPFETSVLIVLDAAISGMDEEGRLYLADLACECAVAISYYSLKAGHRVLFHFTGHSEPRVFDSVRDFPRLYSSFAGLEFKGQGDLHETLKMAVFPDIESIYVISAGKDDPGEILRSSGAGNMKWIIVTGKTIAAPAADCVPGVQTVRVAVGDDVAAVLSGAGGFL